MQRCELLRFCCAICGADPDMARRLCEERKDRVDWPALVAVATEFRLGLLLHRAVQSHLAGFVPPAAAQALRQFYDDNLVRCLSMTAALQRVLDRLAAQQIPAMAFKGPVFGAQLHGDVALRSYADLDVLVRERDVAAVTRVMLDDGYRAGMDLSWEVSFERSDGTSVDLHWSIAEKIHQFPLTADELWARRSTVTLAGGAPVATLGVQDTLLAICFNALTEDWQRLDRIADLAALLRANADIDWPTLLDLCRRRGCERIVLIGLHLARELFLVKLPDGVELRLQAHRKAIAAAGYAVDDYLVFAVASTDRRQGSDAWRFLLRMRERPRERIPYYQAIAYGFFKPKVDDAAWQRVSRRVLYAVLRLPLLAIKHGLRAIGHAGLNAPDTRSGGPHGDSPGKLS